MGIFYERTDVEYAVAFPKVLGMIRKNGENEFMFVKFASGTGVVQRGMGVTISMTDGAYTAVPVATDGVRVDGVMTARVDASSADKYAWVQIRGKCMSGARITSSLLSSPTTVYDNALMTDGSTAGVLKPFAVSSSGDPSDAELEQLKGTKVVAMGKIRTLTGTVDLEAGGTTLLGTGTSFFSELKRGDNIVIDLSGSPQTLAVSSIEKPNSLTLEASGTAVSDGTAAVGLVSCRID
jgi:hypothetical protein